MGSAACLSTAESHTAKGVGNTGQNSSLRWPELILTTPLLSRCWCNCDCSYSRVSYSFQLNELRMRLKTSSKQFWKAKTVGDFARGKLVLCLAAPHTVGAIRRWWPVVRNTWSLFRDPSAGSTMRWSRIAASPAYDTPFDTCLSPSVACGYRKISFIAGCRHVQNSLAAN